MTKTDTGARDAFGGGDRRPYVQPSLPNPKWAMLPTGLGYQQDTSLLSSAELIYHDLRGLPMHFSGFDEHAFFFVALKVASRQRVS